MGIYVRVVNRGAAGAPAGIPVTFYRVMDGSPVRIGRVLTSRALLPGESEQLELPGGYTYAAGDDVTMPIEFIARVNDPEDMPVLSFHECRPDNNSIGPVPGVCPLVE